MIDYEVLEGRYYEFLMGLKFDYEKDKLRVDLMDVTGCRPSEAIDLKLWTFLTPDVLELDSNKGSGKRQFGSSVVHELYDKLATYRQKPVESEYQRLRRKFKNLDIEDRLGLQIYGKTLYVTRYMYIAELINEGYTDVLIQEEMAHSNLSSTLKYTSNIRNQVLFNI